MLFPDEHFFTYLLDTWIFSFAKHVLKFSSNSLLSNIFLIDLNECFIYSRKECFIYSRKESFVGNIYSKYFLLSPIPLMLYFDKIKLVKMLCLIPFLLFSASSVLFKKHFCTQIFPSQGHKCSHKYYFIEM